MDPKPFNILLVEDNPDDITLLRYLLSKEPLAGQFAVADCAWLREAQKYLAGRSGSVDVLLLDLGLPDSQGLETLRQLQQHAPGIPIVVFTGSDDMTMATQALREGAQDYLVKDRVTGDLLVRTMRYAVERMKTETALRKARDELEIRVRERTRQLAEANEALRQGIAELWRAEEELRESLLGTIQAIALMVEVRDPYTAGHQRKVADLACIIAQHLALSDSRIEGIKLAGLVHDLGKIYVPESILSKPGKLTPIQMELVKTHPKVGYNILKEVKFPWPIALTVLQHHERMDGSGYPQGLSGPDIILEARIMAVADVVEAMTSFRPYRPALGVEAAIAEISSKRGVSYDAGVVDACISHLKTTGETLPLKAPRPGAPAKATGLSR